jgi:hypothetical protein
MEVEIREHFTSVFGRNFFTPKMERGSLSEILAFCTKLPCITYRNNMILLSVHNLDKFPFFLNNAFSTVYV